MKVVKDKRLHDFILKKFEPSNEGRYLADNDEYDEWHYATEADITTYLCEKLEIAIVCCTNKKWRAWHRDRTIFFTRKSRNKAILACAKKILKERG